MTQYSTLNVKLSDSLFSNPKSGIKFGIEVTLSLQVFEFLIDNSNDETNFLHKLLLTNTKVSRLHKAFANNSSAQIKLLKTQLFKIVHLKYF